ncbi:MAG TPA: branched-chain amino acid ABC transporter permease [Acetobacteraceae bacterium]|jgi:branched-chain amino acid transport system permease protein
MAAYLTAMAISAGIYALLALGVNLTWGIAGMVNLGLAGFFAVGGYTTALLTKSGIAIPLGILAAAFVAAATGAVVALVTVRLRADYLAIVTLGFSESVRIAAANEIWLTNGSDGIAGIPGPWRGTLDPQQFNLMFLGILVAILAMIFTVMQRLAYSPFGRVLRAIRDDEDVVAVAGKHVLAFKVKAFAVGAAVLGVAGALYAHETSYIAPDIFAPLLTLNIILALVAGGIGNNAGAVLGAVLIVALLEGTRFVAPLLPFLAPAQVAALRELLVSMLLLAILRILPEGIVPERIGQRAKDASGRRQ